MMIDRHRQREQQQDGRLHENVGDVRWRRKSRTAISAKIAHSTTSTIATPGHRVERIASDEERQSCTSLVHPEAHDVFFGQFVGAQFAGDAPAAHHVGAIADVARSRSARS